LRDEGLCEPVLVGDSERIRAIIAEHRFDDLKDVAIEDPARSDKHARYSEEYWRLRQRRGLEKAGAEARMRRSEYFSCMMLQQGDADGLVTGLKRSYAVAVKPPLEIIRTRPGRRAGGVYVVITRNDFKFFADCTVNPQPSAEHLAEIALATADLARYFDVKPRVAMLSYSNFGDVPHGESPSRMRRAVEIVRSLNPELEIDGEMQVDSALVEEERMRRYPFSKLGGDANVLIFPDLNAANIAYKLVWRLGGAEVVGPILLGMNKPVNVLQQDASVEEIVNLAAVTALKARNAELKL
jgi:malate dehydrogenase (oxaloacetate-decarboxylating)(NADP+)